MVAKAGVGKHCRKNEVQNYNRKKMQAGSEERRNGKDVLKCRKD